MPADIKSIRIDRAVFQQTLEKKLADLPPLPAVVGRIMQTINDPNANAEELNRLISMDPGLSSKVLRIVNSAYYGFPKRVSTLTHAIVILGFNTVRNLVLGVSAFGQLSQKSMPYGLNRTKFWEHSAAAAVAGGIIARKRLVKTRNAADEAFIGGLLHDMGSLFLDSYFPVQYAVTMAFASREKKTTEDAEDMILGMNHSMVGRRISEHWNFPSHLSSIIGHHHHPTLVSADQYDLTACIHAANILAWQCGYISSEHTQPQEMASDVYDWLCFDEATMEWASAELRRQFDSVVGLVQAMQ